MATREASPATVAAVFAACQPGDTLALIGQFNAWRPAKRAFDRYLTIDCSQAVLTDCYPSALEGVAVVGGEWRGGSLYKVGLRFDRSKRLFLSDLNISSLGMVGNGLSFIDCQDVHAQAIKATGFKNGVVFSRTTDFSLRAFDLWGLDGDGVDLYNVQRGVVEDGDVRDRKAVTTVHPDAVQLASGSTSFKTMDVAVRRVRARGAMQGICGFNHPDQGGQGFERIYIEDSDLEIAYPQAVAIDDCVEGGVTGNVVRTIAGSQYQATININRCTDVIRSGNSIAAFTDPAGRVRSAIIDPAA